MRTIRATIWAVTMALLGTVGVAGPAEAAHVACGQVITQSTTLDSDVGPCPNNGIIVAASNITLNLAGHRVFGTPVPGDGAGILLRQVSGVTVTTGQVSDFDGGVVIEGGQRNTVTRIRAVNNLGRSEGHPPAPGTRYGEGIAIEGSSNNLVLNNQAINNGPFAGIGLYELPDTDHPFPAGPVTGNVVRNNLVVDNVACREGGPCDNDGIRLEPLVGPGNLVEGNQVSRNGLDGIALFADADNNVVRGNSVNANGVTNALGDGIRVFGSSNLIEQNSANENASGGISVGRRTGFALGSLPPCRPTPTRPCPTPGNPRGQNNRIFRNVAGGNGVWDLWDSNPNCDNNLWRGNRYQTANQPCTTTP